MIDFGDGSRRLPKQIRGDRVEKSWFVSTAAEHCGTSPQWQPRRRAEVQDSSARTGRMKKRERPIGGVNVKKTNETFVRAIRHRCVQGDTSVGGFANERRAHAMRIGNARLDCQRANGHWGQGDFNGEVAQIARKILTFEQLSSAHESTDKARDTRRGPIWKRRTGSDGRSRFCGGCSLRCMGGGLGDRAC